MSKTIKQKIEEDYAAYHGDSVVVAKSLPSNSIHYSISSIPFASLYVYSNSDRDLGNCRTYDEFSEHLMFLIREWYRVTRTGRLASIHCMNLPTTKQHDGYIGIKDFRGDIIRWYCGREAEELRAAMRNLRFRASQSEESGDMSRASRLRDAADVMKEDLTSHPGDKGFIYHSEVVIWKDPVTAMQRTKALGLLHKQIKKDSCMSRQGIPDYLVTFRKPGDNDEPVTHTNDSYPVHLWQRVASPIWAIPLGETGDGFLDIAQDINPSDTLQRTSAREERDERHICPLQKEVIRRGIELWSNPGDVVADFFAGIGSTGKVAIDMGRKALMGELKESYYKQTVLNLENALAERKKLKLL